MVYIYFFLFFAVLGHFIDVYVVVIFFYALKYLLKKCYAVFWHMGFVGVREFVTFAVWKWIW